MFTLWEKIRNQKMGWLLVRAAHCFCLGLIWGNILLEDDGDENGRYDCFPPLSLFLFCLIFHYAS